MPNCKNTYKKPIGPVKPVEVQKPETKVYTQYKKPIGPVKPVKPVEVPKEKPEKKPQS